MPTAADLMTEAVPGLRPGDTAGAALEKLREMKPEVATHIYLIDEQKTLLGQVAIETLLAAAPDSPLDDLSGDPPLEVYPDEDAESVALLTVERHESGVAVVDRGRRLVGAIPIGRLLALLHKKHVDQMLRRSGVGSEHPSPTEAHETIKAFKARAPWLIVGLAGGLLAGGVASLFEHSLKREVTLAFFLPLVVYMADAIGTQTETVLVRRLAYGRVSLLTQLMREGSLGLLMGVTIGGTAWAGLLLMDGRGRVAAVVGLTIFSTAIVATMVASIMPWCLDRLGADPATASGPVATVFQDLLSVAIYLAIATALIM